MKVLVIVAGGFHLGYIGCYGNDWIATPTLDRLAAEGVVFDQHYADRPDAAAARLAWRTGCYQLAPLGPSANAPPPASVDLVQRLRDANITTALVVNANCQAPPSFSEGWDHVSVVHSFPETSDLENMPAAFVETLDRLDSAMDWFLWVELSALTPPWNVPDEFLKPYLRQDDGDEDGEAPKDERACPVALTTPSPQFPEAADVATWRRLQGTYARAVTLADAVLSKLLEEWQARRLGEQAGVFVTSDRGLALGEHGVVGELWPWLHEECIHVPLIIRPPGGAEAGRRISALTQPVDLLPTWLEFFQLPPAPVHGHSLWPLVRGQQEPIRPYAVAGWQIGQAIEWAIRTPAWSFLCPMRVPPEAPPRGPQLYVKPDDRWEVNNVVQHHPVLAEYLEQVLRGFVEATQRPGLIQPPPLYDVEAELMETGTGNQTHANSGGTQS